MTYKKIEDAQIEKMTVVFKALSDASRLSIVDALSQEPMYVKDIVDATELSQPLVSHHLKILKDAGLVRTMRHGKKILYTLDDEHVENIYLQAKDHALHT